MSLGVWPLAAGFSGRVYHGMYSLICQCLIAFYRDECVSRGEGYWFKDERAVILCYNYTHKTVSHMSTQVRSDDLRAMNGFDIENVAGETGRIQTVHMEWTEQDNGLFAKSFCTTITASFKTLFTQSSFNFLRRFLLLLMRDTCMKGNFFLKHTSDFCCFQRTVLWNPTHWVKPFLSHTVSHCIRTPSITGKAGQGGRKPLKCHMLTVIFNQHSLSMYVCCEGMLFLFSHRSL